MGRRGTDVDRSSWPADGPFLKLLRFLDRVRVANGRKNLRAVANAMNLSSPDRVSRMLRGLAMPTDEAQMKALVRALGGGMDDIDHGVMLFQKAVSVPRPPGALRPAGPEWWRRSTYLDHVRDFAPIGGLLDRNRELAELAAFCHSDEAYVWWQARPWAGKSALMSTFVLHPPPDVDIVSFFVTARLAAYADSAAFTAALVEQLVAVVAESPSRSITGLADHHHLRTLWTAAMERATRIGRQLVLVVDGLDEDRAAVAGTGMPSIASLLPRIAGLRVIVSSRPDPPIATDVDDDHPIRTSRVRVLDVSPHASRIEQLARRELDELLTGDRANQEVIGFVTASGGGLSLEDLQELTGRARFELDRTIGGVCGRTVAARPGHAEHGEPPMLLFTHDTLRMEAVNRLGREALQQYRERLHVWADLYRYGGWPAETPTYLLRDYPRMLLAEHGLERLVVLASDPARHDRMLDTTGGDAAALAEISAAQNLTLSSPTPNLLALARLAIHQDELAHRNDNIPANLPAVWAVLGQPLRAEALARGITNPDTRTTALIMLIKTFAALGDHERATGLADTADAVARTSSDPGRQAHMLMSVSNAMAAIGNREGATALLNMARTVIDGFRDSYGHRPSLLAALAHAAASQGDIDQAGELARRLAATKGGPGDVDQRGVGALVKAMTAAGDLDRAEQTALLVDSRDYLRMVRLGALAAVAVAALREGDRRRFLAMAEEITTCEYGSPTGDVGDSYHVGNSYHVGSALASLVAAAAAAGWYEQAERLARRITDQAWRARTPADLAKAMTTDGDEVWAATATCLLDEAEGLIDTLPDWDWMRDPPLSVLSEAIATSGDYGRAERIAHQIWWPYRRAAAISAVARAAADRGDRTQGRLMAGKAESYARATVDAYRHISALTALLTAADAIGAHVLVSDLAAAAENLALAGLGGQDANHSMVKLGKALVAAGHHDRAERIAAVIDVPGQAADVLRAVQHAVAAGDVDRAVSLAQTSAKIQPSLRAVTYAELAKAVAEAGDFDRAESLARAVTEAQWQSWALEALVAALAAAGRLDRAQKVAVTLWYPPSRAAALQSVMEAAAATGQLDWVDSSARAIDDPGLRTRMLTKTIQAAAQAGDRECAAGLIGQAETNARAITDLTDRAKALVLVAQALTALGGWCEAAYAGALCVGRRGSHGLRGRSELGSAGAGWGGSDW